MDLRNIKRPTVDFLPGTDSAPKEDSPQLSDADGVRADMGSAAFEQVMPAGYVGAGQPSSGNAVRVQPNGAPAADLSDAEIMLRVKAGDDSAFNYLIEKYRRPMISFMYRMVHNSAIAEEMAQEVFLRVYRSREGYAASAKFTTWLYRIATNLAVNHARDNKHERPETKVSLDETDEETGLSIDVADSTLNVEQQMLRCERLAAIRRQVEELPERQRIAVVMHKYQNMDYRQIAVVLHLSESATKSLLFRAYQTLRETLKDFI
jgi:RNA polymerase sigma-70 factor (ECF subfamily)